MHKYSTQWADLFLSIFLRVETLEVEEKSNLQEVAVQFHVISECAVPPVAEPDLIPCHVTEGSSPTFSACAILPFVTAPAGFFFSLSLSR